MTKSAKNNGSWNRTDLWGFCDLAVSFCRLVGASGILVHLIWRGHSKICSLTLGHWIMPFLSILVVQIGTMKCFYCPQNDASVVHWDSLSRDDQIFLQDKYHDAGQGEVFDLCVRSARPSVFSSRRSSSTSSSAPQSADSELQVPSGPLVVFGAATSLATESVESGVVEPSASVAESTTPCVRPEHGHTRPARLELDRLSTQRVQKRMPAPHLPTPVPALPPKVLTPPPPYRGWTKQRPHTAAHRNPI